MKVDKIDLKRSEYNTIHREEYGTGYQRKEH
jgi:hypothetical protein